MVLGLGLLCICGCCVWIRILWLFIFIIGVCFCCVLCFFFGCCGLICYVNLGWYICSNNAFLSSFLFMLLLLDFVSFVYEYVVFWRVTCIGFICLCF